MPATSSECVTVNRRASVASFRAYASSPTAVAWKRPWPATTIAPDSIWSPGTLRIGSDSPVSSDSSSSRPSDERTTPSAGTWSPERTSSRSSSTTCSTGISIDTPSRTTRAIGALSTASRSNVRFARYSWTIPISAFTTRTMPNKPSAGEPNTRINASIVPRIALNRVKTLARTISVSVRLVRTPLSFVWPFAVRSATSAAVSPCGGVSGRVASSGGVSAAGEGVRATE